MNLELIAEFVRQKRNELQIEERANRYRDRRSRERIPPITHDFNTLVHFVATRRTSVPGVMEAVRDVVLQQVETGKLRFLVDVVLAHGACDVGMHRTCKRVVAACDLIDFAALVKRAIRSIQYRPDVH